MDIDSSIPRGIQTRWSQTMRCQVTFFLNHKLGDHQNNHIMTQEIADMYSRVIKKEIVLAGAIRDINQNKLRLRSEHPSQNVTNAKYGTTTDGPMTEKIPISETIIQSEVVLKAPAPISNVTSVNLSQNLTKSIEPNASMVAPERPSEKFVSTIIPTDPAHIAVSKLAESQNMDTIKKTEPFAESNLIDSKPMKPAQVP
jgi:hypothetical protein